MRIPREVHPPTYNAHSHHCARFYDLVIDPKQVASFVFDILSKHQPHYCLFVGGFFLVAKELQKLGLELVVADYSEEMVYEGLNRIPNINIVCSDIRDLPFNNAFDAVIIIGRVFTHMLTDDDCNRALKSISRSLRSGGILLFDNYETLKIQATDYFNGTVTVHDGTDSIERTSTTALISNAPTIVSWTATYRTTIGGETSTFTDQMQHRSFTRKEVKYILEENNFALLSEGKSFDETSFYALAKMSGTR
ncbi:MAG: class I SAM-dependent methyltransferase [Bdellovibrionales bacterium]|nr:class I SAM-dependent methyltransferase [Bdellovibrionales bacterium]